MIDEYPIEPPKAQVDEAWRRILVDLRDEYARHVVKADQQRESAGADSP